VLTRTDNGVDETLAVYLKRRNRAVRVDLEEFRVKVAALLMINMNPE
jgi:hypothetical protein